MGIRPYQFNYSGEPAVVPMMAGNSFNYKYGDVVGIMSGTSVQADGSPAGTARRLGASVGGGAGSFPIILADGIYGIVRDDLSTDANGVVKTPAAPPGINPAVVPTPALPSRSAALPLMPAVAGAQRSALMVYLLNGATYFIQRHKKGTRVNSALNGKQAALTYNTVTNEFEVDTTAGSPSVVVEGMAPTYNDNSKYYDSATFAIDAVGAWVVFRVLGTVAAEPNGLTYPS